MKEIKNFFDSRPSHQDVKAVDFTRVSSDGDVSRPMWSRDAQRSVTQWWPSQRVEAPQRTQAPSPAAAPAVAQAPRVEAPPSPEEAFEAARLRGHEEGLEQGRAEAEAAAREDYEREVETLKQTTQRFAQEIEALGRMRQQMLEEAENQMIALCIDVGQRLACEAQLGETQWVAPVIRQAAEALTDADRIVCKVSSELASRLDQDSSWPEIQGMVFDIAPDLDALDIVVESRFGRVDASFRERLRHLERAVKERVEKVVVNHSEQEVA